MTTDKAGYVARLVNSLRGSREKSGTWPRIQGTTEPIQSRRVGRDWRTLQPVIVCEDCERVVRHYFCEWCGSTRLVEVEP